MSGLPCPAEGCTRQRRNVNDLLCLRCWYRVPRDLRSEVWRAWGKFQDGDLDLPGLRGVQQQAIDAVGTVS